MIEKLLFDALSLYNYYNSVAKCGSLTIYRKNEQQQCMKHKLIIKNQKEKKTVKHTQFNLNKKIIFDKTNQNLLLLTIFSYPKHQKTEKKINKSSIPAREL